MAALPSASSVGLKSTLLEHILRAFHFMCLHKQSERCLSIFVSNIEHVKGSWNSQSSMSVWGPPRPVQLGAPPQHTCVSSDVECTQRDLPQQGEDDFAEVGYCLYPESEEMVVPSNHTGTATSDSHSPALMSHSNHSTGSNVFLSGESGGDLFLSQGESSVGEGQYFNSSGTAEDIGRDGSWSPAFAHTSRVTGRDSSSEISDVSSIYPFSPSSENVAIMNTSEWDNDGHAEPDKVHRVPGCYTCTGKSLIEGSNIQERQAEAGSSFHSLQSTISSIIEERQRFQDVDNWTPCQSFSLSFCDTSSVDDICDFESIVPQDDEDILSLSEICANSEETHIVTFNGESQRRCSTLPHKHSSQSMETVPDIPADEASLEDQDLVKIEHTGKGVDPCWTLSNEKCLPFVSSNVTDTKTHQQMVTLGPISYDLNTSVIMRRGICNKKEISFPSGVTTRCQPIESLLYSSTHSSPQTPGNVSPHISYSGGFKSSLKPQLPRVIIDHVVRDLAKTAIALSLQETANEMQRNIMQHPMGERGAIDKAVPKLGANEVPKTSIENSTALAMPPLKSAWMTNAIKKFESLSDFKSCIDVASTIDDTCGEKVEQTVDANEGRCSKTKKVTLNEPHKDRLIPAVQQSKWIQHTEQRTSNGVMTHSDSRCMNVPLPAGEHGVVGVNCHPKVQYPVCITETHNVQQLQDKVECVLPATKHNVLSESQPCDVDEKSETFETDSETGYRECVQQPTSPLCMPAIPPKTEPFANSEHQHSYHRKLRDACHAEQKRILAFHSSPNTILCEIDGKVTHSQMFATYERLVPTEGQCDGLSGSEDCDMVKVDSLKQKNGFRKRKSKSKACPKREQNNFLSNIGSQKGLMQYAVYILPNNILENQNSAANYSSVFAEETSSQLSPNLSEELDRTTVEAANNKRAKSKKKQRSPQKPCNGPVEQCGDPQSVMSRLKDNAAQLHSGKWNKKTISKKIPSSGIISTASGTVNENKLPMGRRCDTENRDLSVIKRATDEQLCEIVAQYTKNYITEVLTGITSLAEKGTDHTQALSKEIQLTKKKGLQICLREKMGDGNSFDLSHQLNVSDEHSVNQNISLELSQECEVMKETGCNTDCGELQTAKYIPSLTSTSTIPKTETTTPSVRNEDTCYPNDKLIHNTASAFVAALVLSGKSEHLAQKVLERAEQEVATYMIHCRKQQISLSSSKPLPAPPYYGSEIRERTTAAARCLIKKAFGQLQIKLEEIGLTGNNSQQKQDSTYKLEAYEIATGCILGAMHDNSLEKARPMPELWPSHTSSSNIRKVTNATIGIYDSTPHMAGHKSQTYVARQMPTQLTSSVHSHPPTSDVPQSLHPQGGTGSVSAKDPDVHTRPTCPSLLQPDRGFERYKMLVEPSNYPYRSSCVEHENDIDKCVLAENQDASVKETPYFDKKNTKPLQERYASQYYSRRIQCALCKKQQ